ncbi:WLM domain-containing protein [Radiomyces spectabilis]|uniref:WLM domain-containing protein n=1 Tax=Radiomyces spectabilis TaxID=64574 RepID=UPI0022204D1C|nr:WLM domain-containing protein [Radiomyces spectabilis]KAI8369317.1 WLM domain-containing protein [Radiomyces spectabilis]
MPESMDQFIKEFKPLKRKKDPEQACQLLHRIASQVKPIMKKRSWKVTQFCEFFPSNPNLLGCNVNRGYKINIRLRPHYDDTQFLDYNDLLGTMLHELAHIVRGPHDVQFYTLLEELNKELDELILSGYTGEGFLAEGHRLGVGVSHSVSPAEARKKALAAATRRKQLQQVMLPSGGRRLGSGSGTMEKNLSPREMAARAAEKRLQDQKWCGGCQTEEDPDSESPSTAPTTPTTPVTPTTGKRKPSVDDTRASNKKAQTMVTTVASNVSGWACPTCTFQNREVVLACEICLAERPHDKDAILRTAIGWICPQCTLEVEEQWWTCRLCSYTRLC